jgi:hypothetical protein
MLALTNFDSANETGIVTKVRDGVYKVSATIGANKRIALLIYSLTDVTQYKITVSFEEPAAPAYGKQANGTYTLDPTAFQAFWYGSKDGNTLKFNAQGGLFGYLFPTGQDCVRTEYERFEIVYTSDPSPSGGDYSSNSRQLSFKTLPTDGASEGVIDPSKTVNWKYPYADKSGTILVQNNKELWGSDGTNTNYSDFTTSGNIGFALQENYSGSSDKTAFNITVTSLTFYPAAQ